LPGVILTSVTYVSVDTKRLLKDLNTGKASTETTSPGRRKFVWNATDGASAGLKEMPVYSFSKKDSVLF
jgi:hypothetical protein